MNIIVVVHMTNEEPILCEVEKLPDPTDQFVSLHNPRRRDGKDLHYLEEDAMIMMVPWHRINFIETLPSAEDMDDVITFVREQ